MGKIVIYLQDAIIGVFKYYSLSFIIYLIWGGLEFGRFSAIEPILAVILFFYFVVERTFLLVCICIFRKYRRLIFNTSFIISQALFGSMVITEASELSYLIRPNGNLCYYIDVIMNFMFIISFSYIYNRRETNNVNPLVNTFHILFSINEKNFRREDFTYIYIVVSWGIFIFFMLLHNILVIFDNNTCEIVPIHKYGL